MINHYWIKDQTRKAIITKTPIPNCGKFNFFANYYNLMDAKGFGFQINDDTEIEVERLHVKNGFHYIVLEINHQKEFFILHNEGIEGYVHAVLSKAAICTSEDEIVRLLLDEMK